MIVKCLANYKELSVQNKVLLFTWLLLLSSNLHEQSTNQWLVVGKRHAEKWEKHEKQSVKFKYTGILKRASGHNLWLMLLTFCPQLPTLALDTLAPSDSDLCCTFFHLLSFVFLLVRVCRRSGQDSHNLQAVKPRWQLGSPVPFWAKLV